MEFLHAIGTHARKTGLKAKEDVRLDDFNMEDLDDFFKDTTVIQDANITERRGRKSRRNTVLPLEITQQQEQQQVPSTFQRSHLASPLPLQQQTNQRSRKEENHGQNSNNELLTMDEHMSPIRLSQIRPTHQPTKPLTAQRLFVEDSLPSSSTSRSQHQNITIRSNKSHRTANSSVISTPGSHAVRPIVDRLTVTSPLNSIRTQRLESPMRIPSSVPSAATSQIQTHYNDSIDINKRYVTSLTKNIALNKKPTTSEVSTKTRIKIKDYNKQGQPLFIPNTPPTKVTSDAEDNIQQDEDDQSMEYTTLRQETIHDQYDDYIDNYGDDEDRVMPEDSKQRRSPIEYYNEDEDSSRSHMSYESDHSLYDAHENATQVGGNEDDEGQDSAVPDESIDSPVEEEENEEDIMEMSMRGRTRERSRIIEDDEGDKSDEESTGNTEDTTIPLPPSSRSQKKRTPLSRTTTSLSRASSRQREQSLQEHRISLKKLASLQRKQSDLIEPTNSTEAPTRRSKRVRMAPLAYWRNERPVYHKKPGDLVPTIKEIITVDEPEPVRLNHPTGGSRANSRKSSRANSRRPSKVRSRLGSRLNSPVRPLKRGKKSNLAKLIISEEQDEDDEDENDLELQKSLKSGLLRGSEWLRKDGSLTLSTYQHHGSDAKTSKLIAWSSNVPITHAKHISTSTDNFHLSILFDDNKDFSATGIMHFPGKSQGGRKSIRSTEETCFVFYCMKGVLEVTLSGNVFIIEKGCSLEVPMGNFYGFTNLGQGIASLFFVQTRSGSKHGNDNSDGSGDDSEL